MNLKVIISGTMNQASISNKEILLLPNLTSLMAIS